MANPVQLIAETVRDRARRGELETAGAAEDAVREELRRNPRPPDHVPVPS